MDALIICIEWGERPVWPRARSDHFKEGNDGGTNVVLQAE